MTDYEKLKQIIDEIPSLISANTLSTDAVFKAWKTKAERFLLHKYGENSYEYTNFNSTLFTIKYWRHNLTKSDYCKACQSDLETTQKIFQTYLDEMTEEGIKSLPNQQTNYSKIFIVHGHDGELRESVARVIEKQGIEAIILSEQANQGKTIIEKFENNSDVGGAVCLFTADDLGRKKAEKEEHSRARQNVVFEAGYFMGKRGRDRIVILADEGVELPSDLSGIVYTHTKNWQFDLLKELKSMGYQVDTNKLLE